MEDNEEVSEGRLSVIVESDINRFSNLSNERRRTLAAGGGPEKINLNRQLTIEEQMRLASQRIVMKK